jgi:hypothetical protein
MRYPRKNLKILKNMGNISWAAAKRELSHYEMNGDLPLKNNVSSDLLPHLL